MNPIFCPWWVSASCLVGQEGRGLLWFLCRKKQVCDKHRKFTLQTSLRNYNMFYFMFPKLFATGSCAWSESRRCSGIPDEAGAAPCSLWLGIIQFTNVEHLGNLGAKKRSSWLEAARFLDLRGVGKEFQGMFCFCCGANNRAVMFWPLLCSMHHMKDFL